jgi:hypothetical protein
LAADAAEGRISDLSRFLREGLLDLYEIVGTLIGFPIEAVDEGDVTR